MKVRLACILWLLGCVLGSANLPRQPGYTALVNHWGHVLDSYTQPDGGVGEVSSQYMYEANGIDLGFCYNSLGQWLSWEYSSNHQATNVSSDLGTAALGWDAASHNLTGFSLPSGLSASLSYYSSNALAANGALLQTISWSPTGRSLTFTWTNGLPRTVQDDRGLNLTNFWDGLNRLTGTAFPDGTTTSNVYDRLYPGAARDRLGNWTGYGYDALEHLTSITDARSNVTQLGWCDCGALSSITDPLTNTTSLFYNNQGLLTNILFADSSSLTYTLDSLGRVSSAADGLGKALSYGYNNQGLVTTASNAYGLVAGVLYDAVNRPIQVTDANNVTITHQFDSLNRLVGRLWPGGAGEGFGWETNGLVAYTNQNQKVTRFARDGAGRVLAETNANLEVTRAAYNALDNMTDLWDGRNNHTGWGFDQYGLLASKTNALSQVVLRLTRDPNGQVTNRWTPQFGNTAYALDPCGYVTNVLYAATGQSISYTLDALHQIIGMVDQLGTTTFGHTPVGQLQSEDGPWSNDTLTYGYTQGQRTSLSINSLTFGYAYDGAWRLNTLASPAGSFAYNYDAQRSTLPTLVTLPNAASITNHYDSLARLDYTALINYWGHVLDGYSYGMDLLGLRTNIVRNLGLTNSSVAVGYDSIGQITSWSAREGPSGPLRLNEQLALAYDPAGNAHSRINGGLVQTFNCDALNQLTNITRNSVMTVSGATPAPATNVTVNGQPAQRYGDFTFACTNVALSNGNNTFSIIAQSAHGLRVTNTTTSYLPSSISIGWDSDGNLTNDGARSFAYSPESQLTNITAAGAWKTDLVYDGLGRRRVELDYAWQGGNWTKTNELHFIYDGWLLMQVRDGNNNVLWTGTRSLDLSGSLSGAGGIGGLLARTDGNGSTFYHADGGGNVTGLIDGQQNMAERLMFGPFGTPILQWGPMAGQDPMGFSSMPQVHGVVLYPGRPYLPGLQRWGSREVNGNQ